MKKSIKTILFSGLASLFLMTSSAEAALPPFYQSLREYTALLNSPELAKQLGSGQVIQSIQRTDTGFIVKANRSTINVEIVYDPMEMPGPAKFHFLFSPEGNTE